MSRRPLSFVLGATDEGPMILSHLDQHRLLSGDIYGVGYQLLSKGSYDPEEVSSIKNLLDQLRTERGDGVRALDCGANIGVHTVAMARHMTGWGTIIGVEAQERLYYALCGNIALNNCFNASAIQAAVGNENGLLKIPQPSYLKPASFGSLELRHSSSTEYIGQTINYNEKALVPITMMRIDSLTLPRLDFLKLDVEGMEIEALFGGKETIAQFRPVILVEWIKSNREDLENFLLSFKYDVVEYGANLLASPKSVE